uniref:Neurogenic locus notch homolog protein 1-like n=1 Tax=Phallusia mammillata TaxID=59560 RepID=A0A6F9DLT7_9ASCI|nr:neurogenic locus notch homolog protein 1-like [Phallusia mammillata]
MSWYLLRLCVLTICAVCGNEAAPVRILESKTVDWWSRGLANPPWRPIQNISSIPVDLIFLIDGSGSVERSGLNSFLSIKSWVKQVARGLNSSKGNVQMGVVQFSHHYKNLPFNRQKMLQTVLHLGACLDYQCFDYAVDHMKIMGYTTFIGAAINKTVLQDFAKSRKGAKQILILLTNGASDDDVSYSSEIARGKGIKIFSIGVGDYNLNELQVISNGEKDNNQRVYQVSSFDKLSSITGNLHEEIKSTIENPGCQPLLTPIHGNLSCSQANNVGSVCTTSCDHGYSLFGSEQRICTSYPDAWPTWTGSISTCGACRGKFDLLFIVDSSSSVGAKNFAITKDFLMKIIDTFEIGVQHVQVAVMTYNRVVNDMWDYKKYQSKDLLIQAVTELYYNGTGTKTGQALGYAIKHKFNKESGRRMHIPHITVVVTDGRSQDKSNFSIFAPKLQQLSNVIAVGVDKADKEEVRAMASKPKTSNYLLENTYWDLLSRVRNMSTQICAAQTRHFNATCPSAAMVPGLNIKCDARNKVETHCTVSCNPGYKLVGDISSTHCQKTPQGDFEQCTYKCLSSGGGDAVWNHVFASCRVG